MVALDIFEYAIEGNSVLDEATIGEAVEAFMGPARTTQDVDAARASLEQAYRDRGYRTVAVTIPRQTGQDGVIRLTVVESRVRLLTVVGSQYHSIDRIVTEATSLAEGAVPDFDDVEKDLVALNRQPDRRVTPGLKAGATPGTVDVVLSVDDHLPLHGSVQVDNRYSQNTSELRTLASLSYANLWQRGQSLSFSFQTAPENPDDSRVWFGSYLIGFDRSPFSLLFSAIKSDSEVSTVGGTNVIGRGETYGMRGFLTLPSAVNESRSLSLGVEYKRYNTLTALGGQGFSTPVAYFPVTLGFNWSQVDELGNSVSSSLDTTFASALSGTDAADFDDNRLGARSGMFALRGELSARVGTPLGAGWFARVGGQWTEEPLITNEQFSAGGADTVRGYLEAEALGDYAINVSLELRAPTLADRLALGANARPFEIFQPFVFADVAELHVHDALPQQTDTFNLASAGAGLTFKMLRYLDGSLNWATTLRDGPTTDSGSSRVLFRVRGSF